MSLPSRIERARKPGMLAINLTPSMEVGWYLREDTAPHVGAIARIPLMRLASPELAAALYGAGKSKAAAAIGQPVNELLLLKRIVAGPGDVVSADGTQISVNGRPRATRFTETEAMLEAGCPMPCWHGSRTLGADKFLLLADCCEGMDERCSFDGRYVGPVSRDVIEGVYSFFTLQEFEEMKRRMIEAAVVSLAKGDPLAASQMPRA